MSALDNVSDISTGIFSGVTIGLLQGLGETGALLTDLAFDTNNAGEVTDFFEDLKYKLNLNPETPAGEIAETISPFLLAGIPVVGWASIASKAATGAKLAQAGTLFGKSAQSFGRTNTGKFLLGGEGFLSNVKKGAVVSGGTGFADFMVAPSTNQTLVDSFDVLSDIAPIFETEGDSGLYGREDALRKLQNKLKIGSEGFLLGAGISTGLETAFKGVGLLGTGIGQGRRFVADIPLPAGSSEEARTLGSLISNGFEDLNQGLQSVPVLQAIGNTTNNLFRSSGNLEKSIFERIKDAGSNIDADVKMSVTNFAAYDRAVREAVGGIFKSRAGKGKAAYEKAYDDLLSFLEGQTKALDAYPTEIKKIAQRLADKRNTFSETIFTQIKRAKDNGAIDDAAFDLLTKSFKQNENSYLRRVYEGGFNSDISVSKLMRSAKYINALKELRKVFLETDPEKYTSGGVINTERLNSDAESFLKQMILKDRFDGKQKITDPAISLKARDPSRLSLFRGAKEADEARIPLINISEGLLQSRNVILDSSPLTRDLMGEVKNGKEAVAARYLQTIMDMSTVANGNKLYNSLLDDPNLTKTVVDHLRDVKAGSPARPLVLDGPTTGLSSNDLLLLRDLGYVRLPSNVKSVFGGQYGDLSGKLVARELVDQLSLKPLNQGWAARFGLGGAWALGIRAKSASQIANTVFSPTSQVRNFLGAPFFLLANGHIPRGGDIIDSIDLTMTKLSKMSDDEYARRQDFMVRNGLSESSAVINEMRDTLKGRRISGDVETGGSVTGFTKDVLNEMLPDTVKEAGKVAGKVAGKTVSTPVKKIFDVYSGVDTVFKQTAFEAERARIAGALRNSIIAGSKNQKAVIDDLDFNSIADDLVDQGIALRPTNLDGDNFLDVMAADITKASMPMYDRVPKAFAFIRDLPIFANFVSFTSEIFRNSRNIIQQGANELAFNSTPQIQAKLGTRIAEKIFGDIRLAPDGFIQEAGRTAGERLQREINAIGLQRLGGYTTSAFIATPAVAAGASALLGVPQKVLDALDRKKAPFYRGHTLVPMSKPDDGKIKYTTLSYFSPYETIATVPKAFMEEYAKQGRLGKDTAAQTTRAVLAASAQLLAPFAEEALLAERIFDVTARKGRTDTGRIIYGENDDDEEKFAKSFAHVLGAMTPTVVRDFVNVEQFNPLSGTLKTSDGRMTLAIKNAANDLFRDDHVDARGKGERVYEPAEEALRYMFGVTTMEQDFKKTLGYDVIEYNGLRNRGIRSELNRNIRRADLDQEYLVDSLKDATEELFIAQQEMYLSIEDAKAGGGLSKKRIEDLVLDEPAVRGATLAKDDYYQISKGFFEPISVDMDTLNKEEDRLRSQGIFYEYPFKKRGTDLERMERSINGKLSRLRLDEGLPQSTLDGIFDDLKRKLGILPSLEREQKRPDVPVLSQRFSSPSASPAASLPTATQPQSLFNPVPVDQLDIETLSQSSFSSAPVDQLDVQTLLGDNPLEQSKNMELFNRLNRNK